MNPAIQKRAKQSIQAHIQVQVKRQLQYSKLEIKMN